MEAVKVDEWAGGEGWVRGLCWWSSVCIMIIRGSTKQNTGRFRSSNQYTVVQCSRARRVPA
jgi:hypothetical protein